MIMPDDPMPEMEAEEDPGGGGPCEEADCCRGPAGPVEERVKLALAFVPASTGAVSAEKWLAPLALIPEGATEYL